MYTPPAFQEDDPEILRALMRGARLSTLVTATADGILATPLPLVLDESEGPCGVLLGHLARANPQWSVPPIGESLVVFMGSDAYISPSWYETKRKTGKVVPTWNYEAVHAYGTVEFFHDRERLHEAVSRLTDLYERPRAEPWAVTDAPDPFIQSQLKGIVGLRLPIARLEGKRKMSQNRSNADRIGVAAGLAESSRASDQGVAPMIPIDPR